MNPAAPKPYGPWRRYFKRPFDLALCLVMLAILWPVMLLTALLVRIKLGSPVIFSQERLGQGRTRFVLYKFRSMSDARDGQGVLLPDDARLGWFGRFLRSTSLDELPQILNILRGDMSFIGPRATLPAYEDFIREKYPRRFDVIPGLTSLPAIRGRNALSIDEKYACDVEYVEDGGFLMDARIFVLTVPVVLSRQGISASAP